MCDNGHIAHLPSEPQLTGIVCEARGSVPGIENSGTCDVHGSV